MREINGLQPLQELFQTGGGKKVESSDDTGFGEIFKKSINAVNSDMQEAESLVAGLVSGQHSNIHETMIAMEKSSISFRLLTKVQSKVITAYQEVMRMQI